MYHKRKIFMVHFSFRLEKGDLYISALLRGRGEA